MNTKEFWVKNVSKRDVSIGDLDLTIPAGAVMNLLNKRHLSYTPEQLSKSASEGSLFRKRDKIKICSNQPAPDKLMDKPIELYTGPRYNRQVHSLVEVKEQRYEELDIDESAHAEEFADLDEKK